MGEKTQGRHPSGCAVAMVVILIAAAAIIGLVMSPYIYNNIIMSRMERELLGTDFGSGAKIAEHKNFLGHLNGNGNGMEFLCVALLRCDSDADIDEKMGSLREKYEDAGAIRLTSPLADIKYLAGKVEFEGYDDTDTAATYYAVYMFSSSIGSDFDIRAH